MKPIVNSVNNSDKSYFKLVLAIIFIVLVFIFTFVVSDQKIDKQGVKVNKALTPPVLSHNSGFYKKSFRLKITSSYPNAKIFYTTNGSKPTVTSMLYSEPIEIVNREFEPNLLSEIKNSPVFTYPLENVYKGTIIRTIILLPDSVISHESQATFFIHPKGRNRYTLPVFSFIINKDDFFGYRQGIYVNGETTDDKDYYFKKKIAIGNFREGFPANYKRRGEEWVREVGINFFGEKSNNGFYIRAGVAIHGNATRERPQKSLKIFMEKKFGSDSLNFPLFGNVKPEYFKSFLLRNSGQDNYKARLRDALTAELLQNYTLVDLQKYKPGILFINGEYWGIYDIRERIDENYFSLKYQIPLDSLGILGPQRKVEYGDSTLITDYHKLEKFILTKNLTEKNNFDYVTAKLDVLNFIDYVVFQTFIINRDWPHNNLTRWKYKADNSVNKTEFPKDGRWRFAIYDTDWAYGAVLPPSFNQLEYVLRTPEVGHILTKLLTNKSFKELFFKRFRYHIDNTFEPGRVINKINDLQAELAPEMEEHLKRWRTLNSVKEWENEVQVLRDFMNKRPAYQKQELKKLESSLNGA